MLRNITIKNLALISVAELEFGEGLNVLSGETGAGKSIIVDAIMLLLGAKYDKTLLGFGAKSGLVEGVFDVTETIRPVLTEMGYDAEDEVIVSRRFFEDGKNEIRINGRMATASMLKRLTEKLVDIYGQHEYISVAKTAEQGRILDHYARHNIRAYLDELKIKATELNELNAKIAETGTADDRERMIDILKFQIDEIEAAKVKRGEEDELTARRKVVASAEKINNALAAALGVVSENEPSAVALVEEGASILQSISHIDGTYADIYGRLTAAMDELGDIAETIKYELDKEFDASDLDKIEDRLDLLKLIRKKYGDYDKMTEFYNRSTEQLFNLINGDKIFAALTKRKNELIREIYDISLKLSAARKKSAAVFETEMQKHLVELGMKSVKFEVRFSPFPPIEECEKHITPLGMDKIEFYFSPNRGQPLQPMTKIISGGEMSRFMLALKVVGGEKDDIPTMIFDEIDAGISGITGMTVAQKLQQIALNHQVLCVTHLPQIVAMATEHFYIEKSVNEDRTYTHVNKLDRDGMIGEIARLSSGLNSDRSVSAAQELKQWCDDYKKSLK